MHFSTEEQPMMKPMSLEEYRAAKARSCISVADNWCAVFRITKDQDKAYSSGRTEIPAELAEGVRNVVTKLSNYGRALSDIIRAALRACTVDFNGNTGAITITFPSAKSVRIDCDGVDTVNLAPVYVAARGTLNEAVFIYFGEDSQAKPKYIKESGWFLWRGNFTESRTAGRIRNYFNTIDEPILSMAFRSYA